MQPPDPPTPMPQPQPDRMEDRQPTSRRTFFRDLIRRAVMPLAEDLDARVQAVERATRPVRGVLQAPIAPPAPDSPGQAPSAQPAHQPYSAADSTPRPAYVPLDQVELSASGPRAGRPVLRPPGAIAEALFVQTCERCGHCVEACPALAIVAARSDDHLMHGTPLIHPSRAGCTVCESLACMSVCPSGALQPTERFEIRMGLAVWSESTCLRTAGSDCRICVDVCPLGDRAIGLLDGRVEVQPGCVGCGLCEERCPTAPARAIRVIPLDSLPAAG